MKRAIERRELERKLLRAMKAKRLSFRTLAAETGLSPFIVTAALLGRMSLPQEGAAKIAALLDITEARERTMHADDSAFTHTDRAEAGE